MSMRQLNPDEVILSGKEVDKLERWKAWREFALKFYGPKAKSMQVEASNSYGDDDDKYTAESVYVLDEDGDALDPDYDLPAFNPAVFDNSHAEEEEESRNQNTDDDEDTDDDDDDSEYDDDEDEQERRDDILNEATSNLPVIMSEETINFSEQPTLTFPEVFVPW